MNKKVIPNTTTEYYYDGLNDAYEYDTSAVSQRYYVHGTSYVDERLMLFDFREEKGSGQVS